MEKSRRISCGIDFHAVPDTRACVSSASDAGYDFMCLPLSHPRFKRDLTDQNLLTKRKGAFTRSDTILNSNDWSGLIVGKLSPAVHVDSSNPVLRGISARVLEQELSWAGYLGLSATMIDLPNSGPLTNLSRIINNKMKTTFSTPSQVWIRVPMVSKVHLSMKHRNKDEPWNATWGRWNEVRQFCDADPKLGVALELSADIPCKGVIDRWKGEPVKCLIINTNIFLCNKKGYPVLTKPHQDVIMEIMEKRVGIIISGNNKHRQIQNYQQYIHFLSELSFTNRASLSYSTGFEDFLQCPLQPLMDNLDSCTYEVFEKDPIKYTEYQRAIYKAIMDIKKPDNPSSLIIMVMGAGRGPIVQAALNAADKASANVQVYAVEKNPNAIVTLNMKKNEEWRERVEVIPSDMRKWESDIKADILVSELLGSFSDNELSPECLDGAQRFLKDNGICIPKEYTSYLCPLQSQKLYSEVRSNRDREKQPYDAFEQLYVVHQQNVYHISPPQPLFKFSHPNFDSVRDNDRFATLTFDVKQDCVLHGFSGFFETILYDDVKLSIVPETFSKGLCSWFPVFIPIRESVLLRENDKLETQFWRLSSAKSVWYEWTISKPIPIPVHNPNGRSYTIGLQT